MQITSGNKSGFFIILHNNFSNFTLITTFAVTNSLNIFDKVYNKKCGNYIYRIKPLSKLLKDYSQCDKIDVVFVK